MIWSYAGKRTHRAVPGDELAVGWHWEKTALVVVLFMLSTAWSRPSSPCCPDGRESKLYRLSQYSQYYYRVNVKSLSSQHRPLHSSCPSKYYDPSAASASCTTRDRTAGLTITKLFYCYLWMLCSNVFFIFRGFFNILQHQHPFKSFEESDCKTYILCRFCFNLHWGYVIFLNWLYQFFLIHWFKVEVNK